MPIFTNKVSKQKFVAKIRDSYWLFEWGEWDIVCLFVKSDFWLDRIRENSGFVVSELVVGLTSWKKSRENEGAWKFKSDYAYLYT